MVMKTFRPVLISALLPAFAISIFGTTCAEPSREEAALLARQDGFNLLVKGFLLGLMLAVYLFNVGWYFLRTKRWVLSVLLSLLWIPVLFLFWIVDVLTGACGFGGIEAVYYLMPLTGVIFIALGQLYWVYRSNQKLPSMFADQ